MNAHSTLIETSQVAKWARFLGLTIDLNDTSERNNAIAGLITRELRSRGLGGQVVCACGNGPDPAESADAGLYIDNAGAIRRICGPCWLRETTNMSTTKTLLLIPVFDIGALPSDVYEELEAQDVDLCQVDILYLHWEDASRWPLLKQWALSEYGEAVQTYRCCALR